MRTTAKKTGSAIKPLYEELAARKKDNPSKAYTELCWALEQMTKVGVDFDTKDEKGELRTNNDICSERVFTGIDYINKQAKEYEKEDPEFAKKVQDFTAAHRPGLEESYNKNVKAIFEYNFDKDKYKKNNRLYFSLSSRAKETTLHRIEVEQAERLKYKMAAGRSDIESINKSSEISDQKAKINSFKDEAIQMRMSVGEQITYFSGDKYSRIANDDKTSKEYNALIEATDELAIKTAVPDKHTPAEVYTAIKNAAEAAERYTQTHKGIWKGNFGEGAVRYQNAKEMGETLRAKMKELEEKYMDLPAFQNNETIANRTSSLAKKKEQVKKEAAEKQIKGDELNYMADTDSLINQTLLELKNVHQKSIDEEKDYRSKKDSFEVYASQIIAAKLLGRRVKAIQDESKGSLSADEIKELQEDLLSVSYIKDNAAVIRNESDEFKRMMSEIKTPEQLDFYIDLVGKNNGNLLIDKISRTRKDIIKEDNEANNHDLNAQGEHEKARSTALGVK